MDPPLEFADSYFVSKGPTPTEGETSRSSVATGRISEITVLS